MANNIKIESYINLRAVCRQARDELRITYDYFKKIADYNGVTILYREICDIDNLFSELDKYNPRFDDAFGQLPNIYEWGFYELSFINEAHKRADAEVLNAVNRKIGITKQKYYINNGCFYGYCCYNIYNKCLGWVNGIFIKYPIAIDLKNLVLKHLESKLEYFMKFEDN